MVCRACCRTGKCGNCDPGAAVRDCRGGVRSSASSPGCFRALVGGNSLTKTRTIGGNMPARILFTGGTGKAGRHMLPWLANEGYQILNFDLLPFAHPTISTLLG